MILRKNMWSRLTLTRSVAAAILLLTGCSGDAPGTGDGIASDIEGTVEAENVRLVGYNDLQGRETLVVTTKSDDANGNWVYVGHHESYYDGEQRFNPITNEMEWNGTSILEISDRANPMLVWHIPNEVSANSRGVSVVYDYPFDDSGRGLSDSKLGSR